MYPAIGVTRCSSRWCPTAEQVMILEELYKGGLTNPSAGQIHQIVAHLSRFGNIQGKNVFYWFQNHKARDKQRVRKKLVREQQLVGFENIQCWKNPNCLISSSVSHSNNDETLKRSIRATVFGGEKSKPNTNARCCGGTLRMQDSVWSSDLKLALPQPKQQPSCESRCTPPLVTLDLFPVTPILIKEVECRNYLSRNYPSVSTASQLLPNPNLTLGAPGTN